MLKRIALGLLSLWFIQSCTPQKKEHGTKNEMTDGASVCQEDMNNIKLMIDSVYKVQSGKTGIDLRWDPVPNATSYVLTTSPGGSRTLPSRQTKETVELSLQINESFSASVTATMPNGATCGPVSISTVYMNNGGTSDDIFAKTVGWPGLCQKCYDYLSFKINAVDGCTGNLPPISRENLKGIYYKKTDLCNCLTNNGNLNICDGLSSGKLNTCLNEITKFIKDERTKCD